MNAGERISHLIDHLKISKNKFSTKMLGLSASTKVDHIIKGRNDITPEFAKEICKVVPEIEYDWLLKGEGKMFKENYEEKRERKIMKDMDIKDLAITILEYEDELMKLPLINKMIERHALIMLNDKLPELIDKIYKLKMKS